MTLIRTRRLITVGFPVRFPIRFTVTAFMALVLAATPGTGVAAVPVGAVGSPGPATIRPSAPAWLWPLDAPDGRVRVVRDFDPPDRPWLSGHRGVDLHAVAGARVRAAAAGRVTYAGLIAGRGVVVVDHGSVRTTYEPVSPAVGVGDAVAAGEVLGGVVATGSHCAPAACLHWGARRGDTYLDPLAFVGAGPVRLLPLGDRTVSGDPPPPSAGALLAWPVAFPVVTSPYGMRRHPVTGVHKLHDGTDFRAACGTPVRSSAPGRVSHAGSAGAYGVQVGVDHGQLGGRWLYTSYSHLSRLAVRPGQAVGRGQVVGWAGSTGRSTGCHLHFMVIADGGVTDPARWLAGFRTGLDSRYARG
jgi:murein DD-endopeptidase MepM/ murein hydrolase activator NlpD